MRLAIKSTTGLISKIWMSDRPQTLSRDEFSILTNDEKIIRAANIQRTIGYNQETGELFVDKITLTPDEELLAGLVPPVEEVEQAEFELRAITLLIELGVV